MNLLWSLLLTALSWWPAETHAEDYGKYTFPNVCRPESIIGQFNSTNSSYKFSGSCLLNKFPYRWTAEGSYSPKDGLVNERLVMADEDTRAEVQSSMICSVDPWLGNAACRNVKAATQGQIVFYVNQQKYNETLQWLVLNRKNPLTTSLSYDRGPLRVQRAADLTAEANAAKAKADKRLRDATQQPLVPYRAGLSPVIVAPATGQRFLNQTAVPIKLAPPKGWMDTQVGLDGTPVNTNRLYMVRFERRDAAGNWVLHTTFPVGAPQAESATGYTGFGAGAPPSGITSPGSWRLSAQMSSPTATGWSDWVEFVVMAPNTAIQKTPKMFGQ